MATRSKFWETAPRDPIFDSPRDKPRERLTAEGNAYLARTGQMPPRDSDVRADSAVSMSDGLKMTEFINDAGGKVRTFENTTGRKQWLDRFRAPMQEQVAINTKNRPKDEFPAIERQWRADREARNQAARDIAAGRPVLCDLSYSCHDLQG